MASNPLWYVLQQLVVAQQRILTWSCRFASFAFTACVRPPALADIAVLRFNFRGVESPRGRSEGSFGEGHDERHDLAAAMDLVAERGLPHPWLLGWSFGTEVALKHGLAHAVDGAVLLSPPLHRTSDAELQAWAGSGKRLGVVVPELGRTLIRVRPSSR